MGRSSNPSTLIPRSFFPSKKGSIVILKDGTKLTLESDEEDTENFFCLHDGRTEVKLYFYKGFLTMYDIPYSSAWSGAGGVLLNKIRALSRGKFPSIRGKKSDNTNSGFSKV